MGIRDLLAHLTSGESVVGRSGSAGAVPIASAPSRQPAAVVGTIGGIGVTDGAAPVLEVTVSDGSGTITALFLGRRGVPALDPGRRIRLEGLVVDEDGRRVIRSPYYRLLS